MVLFMSTASFIAHAEDPTPEESMDNSLYDKDGKMKIAKCFTEGGQSFTTFLKSMIWSDSFAEGIVEPWKDVLVRNSCHGYDILGLVQKRDKLRQQIRDALLTCQNAKVPQLKDAYYKTSTEIYYARNVVTGGIAKRVYKDLTTLHAEMTKKYVKGNNWFTPDAFAVFLNELDVRYAERKSAYNDKCEMTSWKDVKNKFKEFVSGDFAKDIKNSGAQLKRKAQKVKKAWGDSASWKEWGKNLGQMNLNGQTLDDFAKDFMANWNSFDKSPPPSSTQGAVSNKQKSDLVLRAQTLENEMSTRFQMLYATGSDSIITEFMESAASLDKTILDSFPVLDKFKEGAKMTNDRQCAS